MPGIGAVDVANVKQWNQERNQDTRRVIRIRSVPRLAPATKHVRDKTRVYQDRLRGHGAAP